MKIFRAVVFVLALISIGFFVFVNYVTQQSKERASKNTEAMKNSEFVCPEGTEEKWEYWSEGGNSRSCVSPKHGKWEAWNNGYKHIDGYHEYGKKHGKWLFYKSNGAVKFEIEYDRGIEVSNTRESRN